MTEHRFLQAANDWVMCICGKVFSNGKRMTAYDKLEKHLKEVRENGH